MPLIPYQTFCLESPLPPDEVLARLEAAVDSRWLGWPPTERPFRGTVTSDGFRITRVVSSRNFVSVVIRGHICPTAEGTQLEGTVVASRFSIAYGIFTIPVFLFFVAAGLVAFLRSPGHPVPLIMAGLFLVYIVLTGLDYTQGPRRALRRLGQIVGADTDEPAHSRRHKESM